LVQLRGFGLLGLDALADLRFELEIGIAAGLVPQDFAVLAVEAQERRRLRADEDALAERHRMTDAVARHGGGPRDRRRRGPFKWRVGLRVGASAVRAPTNGSYGWFGESGGGVD